MYIKSTVFLLVVAAGLGLLVINSVSKLSYELPDFQVGSVANALVEPTTKNGTSSLLFTGDVMLARDVERISQKIGVGYFFSEMASTLADHDQVVINFEAAVPVNHVPTPSKLIKFSVREEYLPTLQELGVTHASLANNHSDDFAQAGFLNTIKALAQNSIHSFGQANGVSEDSVVYLEYGQKRLAVIGLNSVYQSHDLNKIIDVITTASTQSDIQILYVHWGEEYKLIHNSEQKSLAEATIDAGIDLVIGHHPHVAQDIAIYNNALIFYSLGNFVFDQYFSDEVQQGLMLGLISNETDLYIDLLPVTSIGSKTQPRLMPDYERQEFLNKLASRSDPALQSAIQAGRINVSYLLATSP